MKDGWNCGQQSEKSKKQQRCGERKSGKYFSFSNLSTSVKNFNVH